MAAVAAAAAADDRLLPSFYIYEDPALDHSWMMESRCGSRLEALLLSAHGRLAAEVGLYRALRDHPRRTRDPERADLFYVAVFEYSSYKLDAECAYSRRLHSHKARMESAHAALLASAHWRRRGGRDHFFASSAYNHPSHPSVRMLPLSKLLHCAIAGRYRTFEYGDKRSVKSAVGICTITLPYVSPRQAFLAEQARHATPRVGINAAASRPLFLYFAGALDVCCYGQATRCEVGELMVETWNESSVLIRPQPPNDTTSAHASTLAPCYTRKMAKLGRLRAAHAGGGGDGGGGGGGRAATNAVTGAAAAAETNDERLAPTADSHGARLSFELLRRSDREMASSVFCLVPAGDSAVTDRLYTSMSFGCLPVVVADILPTAFARTVSYRSFWEHVPMRNFIRHPYQTSLGRLRKLPMEEVQRRQRAMARHVKDVLYDVEGSRVGSNFLREIMRHCGPPLLGWKHTAHDDADPTSTSAVVLGLNRTTLAKIAPRRRYEGHAWARRCLQQQANISVTESGTR